MSSSASRAWMASGTPARRAARMWARKFCLLHVAGGAVVEVVQAGLADADDPRVGGQRGEGFGRGDRRLGGVVRVDADGAPEVRVRLGHGRQACGTAPAWCRWSPSRHPGRGGAGQDVRAVRPR